MRRYEHLADLRALVGEPLGDSDWLIIDQARIDRFADATEDRQWIHVDPQRAALGPFGAPIAHGFLTLSLLPVFFESAYAIADVRMAVNYGLDRVRFTAPVPVGSRLRARFTLKRWDAIDGGAQLGIEAVIERDGAAKPVCIAESLIRCFT
ncbi:MaoC family dehydratase [Methylibium sp. T29]|uniref:MaoC family dehydratase n=1 Tax=Methylibium sp. T29 TaxID=1430884 RepID=UPI0003F45F78|nr:MaoC family dehydratase [Methylibium sp. T29]EWS55285.1 putative enoyl-CoA hydratase 1 [Methylibium sp. T29]